ncbi:MAG: hypothetical protein MUP17_12980 [candidate division Zixibacteria bacterium]|nr:hypothetical protein [candidate division Zixibacteria bacterium]
MPKFKALLLVCVFILVSFPAQAKIIHVPSDLSTIQGGINGAVNGDTVLVAPGTYYEHINFYGKAILVKSEAGAESTIINKAYSGVPIATFSSGEGNNSILQGFTIQNAYNPDQRGGGIYCFNSSPTIRNNIVKGNWGRYGGGISCYYYSSPIIEKNRLIGNTSGYHGGAIDCSNQSSPTISRNLMIQNRSNNYFGGAIFCNASSPLIVNNTIDSSIESVGSIYCYSFSSPEVKNTIISNGSSYGIIAVENSYPIITYCDVWNNASGNLYGIVPGIGCISTNPAFCDTTPDNYYLSNLSPCVGAGEGGTDIGAFGVGCGRPRDVELTAGPNIEGRAETDVEVEFFIRNTGFFSDTYDLDITDSLGWAIVPTHYTISLDSGQVDTVSFTVSIPDVPIGTTDKLRLIAVSRADSSVSDTAFLTVNCDAIPQAVEVTAGSNRGGSPMSSVSVSFTVANVGSVRDSYSVDISDDIGWSIVPLHYDITLETAQSQQVSFTVQIPNVEIGTEDQLTLLSVSRTNPLARDSASLTVTCSSYNITIKKISDVGNDQGKQVFIEWLSFPGSDPLVTNFSIFRRKDSLITSSTAESVLGPNLSLKYPPGEWQWLFTIPAYGETLYSAILPTLRDSTKSEGIYWSYFFVRAGTSDPTLFFDSPIDSGYSVDNLKPSQPTGFLAIHRPTATKLIWKTSTEIDFRYFTLYRDTTSEFVRSLSNRLTYTIDTSFVDSTAKVGKPYYYLVSATDFSGNESNPSEEIMAIRYITGDANSDGLITVADVIRLVNYLFKGGPAPSPLASGNVNCDVGITVGDIVYLINYLFKGGPPPCEP